ncbi:hypothetical protein [Haloarcula onubensis]|uniref:Uncharacterized protein n=1 Tax=Haloarcula onubensis TaxID=2950539 RepID=A0ABU2FU13_9EURY|nr:hypothetical protein [Halomicroarcula sp. S3CR25-11]MDS0284238.1 hypothetical protein [Halomicroarcula sp. S3CR25-11]
MNWEDIRRPSHTGENRCWPCTTVNLGLVGVAALWLYRRDRRVGAVALAALGAAAVAVRGYVVPYTPQFAPRLVAALPIPDELFGKDTGPSIPERESLTATELDGTTVLDELAAAGAIEAEGDLIRPTAAVDETWHGEMDRLADASLDALAREAAETIPARDSADSYDDGDSEWVVVDGVLVARPVVVAELAAYHALGDAVADQEVRLAGARAFRMFLDSCPDCGSALVESSAVSCCGGYTDPQTAPEEILVCPDCEQRLFTVPN